jgi:hypothetical protein
MFHTYIATILSGCCICLQWFSRVFMCFCKCFTRLLQVFQLFRMNVLSVSSWCFKSRSCCNVTHLPQTACCCNCLDAVHTWGGSGGMERCSAAGARSGRRWRQGHRQSLRDMWVQQAEGAWAEKWRGCGRTKARKWGHSSLGAACAGVRRRNELQPWASGLERPSRRPGAGSVV